MEIPFVCAHCAGTGKDERGNRCGYAHRADHEPRENPTPCPRYPQDGNPAYERYFGPPQPTPRLYTEKMINAAKDYRLAPLFAAWDRFVEEVRAAQSVMPDLPHFFMNERTVMRVDLLPDGAMEIKMKENK